ncbi:pyridoxamine 5'-phosphate oxidase family protein [Luteolibacter algae]|uniref:Pyridoxamine 5'-phosphate oxidase family protein n=1 Tax=Luteolibacter algae TaxID=454151 RepID=A0ABW5D5M7_9BACT
MAKGFLSRLITPAVQDAQEHYYGRPRSLVNEGEDALTEREIDFIASRDSFYLSTVNQTGWPYVQHRGGPTGFLKVISPQELAFADYTGNRQMLSVGNVTANDRACLFLMDYARKARLKLIGHVEVLDARQHHELVPDLATPDMHAAVERIFKIRLVSYDWNCPQYITPRFTEAEVNEVITPLEDRIAELEAQLAKQGS